MFGFLAKALRNALRPPPVPGAEQAAPARPLDLARGRMVAVDGLPFAFLEGRILLCPPLGDQRIESVGRADLGAGCVLHRYYLSDDAFLQVNTTAGQVEDLKLFAYHDTKTPSTQAEFEAWLGRDSLIGRAELDYGGYRYTRVWGSEDENQAPPVLFEEAVYTESDALAAYTVQHYCMLYERTVEGAERQEYLLVSAEQTGEDYCVVFSVGADLSSADLQIV